MKIYGWEYVFQTKINDLREKEIRLYRKVFAIESLERAMNRFIVTFAGFLCFGIIDIGKIGSLLTTAKIFSVMDLMQFLRLQLISLN